MSDSIQKALAVGEVAWALAGATAAIKSARKAGGRPLYDALRAHAEILLAHADDTHLPDLARAAAAWVEVTHHVLATAEDFDTLAWAELLALRPKKAESALAQAQARDPARERETIVRAVAWARRRTDQARLASLEEIGTTCDEASLERIVRLLVQADVRAVTLADRLCAEREERLDVWDPRVAHAVQLRVAAYRGAGERERAAAILAAWARACAAALPDPADVRRHVLDAAEGTPADELARAERRAQRAERQFGDTSPALELPLAQLASSARRANDHALAVGALQKLEALRSSGRSTAAHALRCDTLVALYKSLIALRRFDEALAAIERYERSKARLPLHLVPDHHARAEVYEAMGDVDRMLEEHFAAVAQYEAAPPPVYGPTANNTRLARGWARMALERAGRHAEAEERFPQDRS